MLRSVAQTLRTNIRGTDSVGRYGGEEFLLIFTETGVDDGAALADKLRQEIERQRYDIDGKSRRACTSRSASPAARARASARTPSSATPTPRCTRPSRSGATRPTCSPSPRTTPGSCARPSRPPAAPGPSRSASPRAQTVLSSLAAVIADLPGDRGRPSPVAVAIATSMAIGLELPEAEVDRIRVAALLRDIGKVAVPTEILAKSSALTSSEWRAIVQHPRIAQVILEQATALREAVPLILHHHERFAGHGYPFGLRGDEIPLGARIVAIADAYDAMTSDRPYKRAMGHEAAIRELRRHAGTQFDPALVRLFCELFSFSAPAPDPEARPAPDRRGRGRQPRDRTRAPRPGSTGGGRRRPTGDGEPLGGDAARARDRPGSPHGGRLPGRSLHPPLGAGQGTRQGRPASPADAGRAARHRRPQERRQGSGRVDQGPARRPPLERPAGGRLRADQAASRHHPATRLARLAQGRRRLTS